LISRSTSAVLLRPALGALLAARFDGVRRQPVSLLNEQLAAVCIGRVGDARTQSLRREFARTEFISSQRAAVADPLYQPLHNP